MFPNPHTFAQNMSVKPGPPFLDAEANKRRDQPYPQR